MLVRPCRIAAPIILSRFLGGNVVPGAKAPAFGPQQHDAGRGVGIGSRERLRQLVLQLRADGVELFWTIKRDDADFFIHIVQNHRISHSPCALSVLMAKWWDGAPAGRWRAVPPG